MGKEEKSCFECNYDGVDAECSGISVCRNFKRKAMDRLIDTIDCIPLDLMLERDAEEV